MSDFDLAVPAEDFKKIQRVTHRPSVQDEDIPPHSIEAEQGWLGCCLTDANVAMDGCEWLNDSHFYDLRHVTLFLTLKAMYEERRPIDLVTVSIHLKREHSLEAIGGMAYMDSLTAAVPSASNATYYAGELKEKLALRKLQEAARRVLIGIRGCRDPFKFAQTSHGEFEGIIQDLEDSGTAETLHGKEAANTLMEDVNEHHARAGKGPEISWGINSLDRITGGVARGELVFIGARPGGGKTSAAVTFSHHIAQVQMKPTLFITLESPPKAIIRRLACGNTKISLTHYRTGFFQERDIPRLFGEVTRLKDSPLFFVGKHPNKDRTIGDIRSIIRYHVRKFGIQVVIVDYLALIAHGTSDDKRTYQLETVAKGLQTEAQRSNVSVICLAQLGRDAEAESGKDPKPPTLKDLSDSKGIEQAGDTVILIHRKREESEGPAALIVAKQRDGELGIAKVHYIGRYTRFYDSSNQEQSVVNEEAMQDHP